MNKASILRKPAIPAMREHPRKPRRQLESFSVTA